MKVRFGMALRQATGFVESLLSLISLGREVPCFSTLSRRQKALAANGPHRGSQGPLRATRRSGHRNLSAVRSGDDGAATTAGAASKPTCTAPHGWVSA
jgi:hypothetical protein